MPIAQSWLPEFDEEMKTTRRVLERVPSDKAQWKPHEKSFPLGHLAQLVARMPGWHVFSVDKDVVDIAGFGGYSYETTETLLAEFDRNVREGRAALSRVTDDALDRPWTLKWGEHVVFSAPRGTVLRQNLNHLYHHRGQLTVYLRLIDVPVPQVYGPTADER